MLQHYVWNGQIDEKGERWCNIESTRDDEPTKK
jgi:hypothetical protein